ncbi:MAG: hypothetical protein ACRC8P_02560 [Spiroplasma sp.]
MKENEKNLLFSNLKFIPQVTLLTGSKSSFNLAINDFLKKIICQNQFCLNDNLCHNCQKLKDNCYFDLNWYKLNKTNILKKQDVINIINTLSYQSLENNNPRICVIEEIEHSSLAASNIFLKFLENLPNKVFLIFTSTNSEKILATIKSRCQIMNLKSQEVSFFNSSNLNLEENELKIIKKAIEKFITYDNNKDYNSNFFLIKELLILEEKIILFFQFLLELAEKKLISTNTTSIVNKNQLIKTMLENWKNNNHLFLIKFIDLLNEVINKFSITKNINLNLLLNYFFIVLYQGEKNG